MTTEEKKLVQKLCWALSRLERSTQGKEECGLYPAGMRDARKLVETVSLLNWMR